MSRGDRLLSCLSWWHVAQCLAWRTGVVAVGVHGVHLNRPGVALSVQNCGSLVRRSVGVWMRQHVLHASGVGGVVGVARESNETDVMTLLHLWDT
jgi:hypothetical protein